jgi:hypothetical protein
MKSFQMAIDASGLKNAPELTGAESFLFSKVKEMV